LPLLTSGKLSSAWLWQADGQWFSSSDQSRRPGPRVPSWRSVAPPLKLIRSPTFHVSPGVGVVIVATGGVLPAVIAALSVALAPCESVARRPTR